MENRPVVAQETGMRVNGGRVGSRVFTENITTLVCLGVLFYWIGSHDLASMGTKSSAEATRLGPREEFVTPC